MAIFRHIHHQDKGRKVYQNADPFDPDEPTAGLEAMGVEAVERDDKAGHMKCIADQDSLSVQGNDSQTTTQDQKNELLPIWT